MLEPMMDSGMYTVGVETVSTILKELPGLVDNLLASSIKNKKTFLRMMLALLGVRKIADYKLAAFEVRHKMRERVLAGDYSQLENTNQYDVASAAVVIFDEISEDEAAELAEFMYGRRSSLDKDSIENFLMERLNVMILRTAMNFEPTRKVLGEEVVSRFFNQELSMQENEILLDAGRSLSDHEIIATISAYYVSKGFETSIDGYSIHTSVGGQRAACVDFTNATWLPHHGIHITINER